MRDRFKRLPSPSMGVAFVALLAALTGTAVALPGNNSVTSGDIKKNAVRSSDIKGSNVGSSDVKNNALTGSDVDESKLGEVPSATNADNAANATNATTAATATNALSLGGVAAADHLRQIRQVIATSPSNSTSPKTAIASCASNEEVVGGGGLIGLGAGAVDANISVQEAYPSQSFTLLGIFIPDSYTAKGVENDAEANNWTVTARALCAKG